MSNCPHCGYRGCVDFIRDTEKGELVACCGCGQEYVVERRSEA